MPGRDGIGPMGRGSMTGRGMGFCTGINAGRTSVGLGREMGKGLRLGMGLGYGCRRSVKNTFAGTTTGLTEKELLAEQKRILQSRLNSIEKQLENLPQS